MDDDKILEKLRDLAEKEKVPESLEPEKIKEKLEELRQEETRETAPVKGRQGFFRRYGRYGSMAAAILALLAALALFQPRGGQDHSVIPEKAASPADGVQNSLAAEAVGDQEEQTEVSMEADMAAVSQVAEAAKAEEAQDTAAASQEKAAAEKKGNIRHVGSYQELYDLIGTLIVEEKTVFAGVDLMYAGAVAEDAVAVQEDAVTNTAEAAPEAAGGEADFSRTNIQEKGVEEADLVKTDGAYLYALGNDGILRIIRCSDLKLTASLELGDGVDSQVKELYLEGDLLQVISTSYSYNSVEKTITMSDGSTTRTWTEKPLRMTMVENIDISDRSQPKRAGSYEQDGNYLTSRRNGGYLYLFTAYSPDSGNGYEAKEAYVPRVGGEFLPCEDIYLMGEEKELYSGSRAYLVAGSLKDGETEAADRMAVIGGGEEFYVSRKNIYAASGVWEDGQQWTSLVRFGYREGSFTPGNVKRIDGYLNDNFSMDEYEDHLRLVVTGESYSYKTNVTSRSNHLYVLDEDLEIVGRIKNLAEGETIKSARFMGDTGYFVTYRNMDPLFSVDLSDPENPRILGELKITGFSQYLHFYGEDQLLGMGWETDPDTGEQLGLKCSIFDISDPTDVRERDKLVLKDVYGCRALDNYKEFLVDPEKNIFGFAYQVYEKDTWEEHWYYGVFSYDKETGFDSAAYLKVPEDLAGDYGAYASLRGLYVGDTFYLISTNGAETYDMKEDFSRKDSLYW